MLRKLRIPLVLATVIAALLPATAAAFPDDPGRGHGWQSVQWNFDGPFGVDAPGAWSNLFKVGKPGGRGVVVAVLDSGVAYRNSKRYKRSPDLLPKQFVRGYDFVDHDKSPLDELGHGT